MCLRCNISNARPHEVRRRKQTADNAAYRRVYIVRHPELLKDGFWQFSFHARSCAEGLPPALEPRLRVIPLNRNGARQFFALRQADASEFGLARAAQLLLSARLLLIALSPVLPLLFLRKIVRTANCHAQYRRPVRHAFSRLPFFCSDGDLARCAYIWKASCADE